MTAHEQTFPDRKLKAAQPSVETHWYAHAALLQEAEALLRTSVAPGIRMLPMKFFMDMSNASKVNNAIVSVHIKSTPWHKIFTAIEFSEY